MKGICVLSPGHRSRDTSVLFIQPEVDQPVLSRGGVPESPSEGEQEGAVNLIPE